MCADLIGLQRTTYNSRSRRRAGHPQVTQRDLEALVLGPEFDSASRMAEVTAQVFVCLTFSAGVPLLLPVGFASLALAYWLDKAAFLRFCRLAKASAHAETAGVAVSRLLPFAALLHLSLGIWMFSSEGVVGEREIAGGGHRQRWRSHRNACRSLQRVWMMTHP